MRTININALFPLMILIVLILALSRQMYTMPPLGKLLDPFLGAVQNERDRGLDDIGIVIPAMGVKDEVHVYFDDRKVPHIYARNTKDLYFAQGYVTAGLRLWQMDFLSYVSSGRLSEILGDKFVVYDRNQRRMGVPASARRSLDSMRHDPMTREALDAYSRGVNAYIGQLSYKELPFEYKLLDYRPEPWSDLKSVLIMKYMTATLSGYEEDYSASCMMLALGEEKFNRLFPEFPAHITPATGDSDKRGKTASVYIKKPGYLDYAFLSSGMTTPINTYNPKLGSNSWAVSGKNTRTGYPILCCDPHLNLTLPAIWVEMQLTSPDMNVYGVSIPGTPAVIIGFNENIAWGMTNGADDNKDWYKLKLTKDYRKYELDGKQVDLDSTVEVIGRRGQAPVLDTVYRTVYGPVVSDLKFTASRPELAGYALRWGIHSASNEIAAFIRLDRAKDYKDYKEAISYYRGPAQNFTFACKDNTIAINHQGNMAVRKTGEGKFIMDGTHTPSLYTEYIPDDSLPHSLNPACGYVLSANQHPTDARYKYYYNGYYSETRANRIGRLLNEGKYGDIEGMEAMQTDNTNEFAADALPVLIKTAGRDTLTEDQRLALARVSTWNYAYDLDNEQSELFELWWKNISDLTWDELRPFPFYTRAPDEYVLLDLIRNDPENIYFDIQGTPVKENAADIVREAFITALKQYNKLKTDKSVKWGDLHKVNIMHLTNLKALSDMHLPSAGCPEAINATSSGWGPSWRMIVELRDRPRAVGIYAGGQSGNTGGHYYDNFTREWNKGKYYPLQFFMSMAEAAAHPTGAWILKK